MSELSDYNTYNFAKLRHIGPSTAEISEMLSTLGYESLDALIDDTLPTNIRQSAPLDIGDALSEDEALAHMREVADQNEVKTSLIGQGYYGTITPTPILRNILENPAWYTAYTPYQPEISQGRLEALLNYQTMMSELTGLAIANASMLDEATAASEAMAMSRRSAKSKANIYFIDQDCHPQNIAVLKTRAEVLGVEVVIGDPNAFDAEKYFGAIFQYPGSSGEIKDVSTQIAALHEHKAIGTVIADPLALCLLKTPADMGADIAIGSTQRFGVPLGYGGPHAAYMCCTDALKRAMPGRIIGVSIDSKGQPALRLALQTREQHIRRDKANSNLCTAQALLAVIASMYAVYHGPRGLQQIAQRVHKKTSQLAQSLDKAGFKIINQTYFDTITLAVGQRQSALMAAALKAGFNLRAVGEDRIGISLDETTTEAKLSLLIKALGGELDNTAEAQIPTNMQRITPPVTHEIFEQNRAEAQITRYMRRLADRDLALDRAMIPLGSCTMKLNATTEMIPVTWPEFADLHPYAPKDQAKGYQIMMDDLSKKLCAITGYDDFSLQPNSGAQGEFAGLLTIRNFHLANGDAHRTTCLIPISAHGTNPATASMVGWKVVPVKSDENGNIDIEDFRSKAAEHADTLAATMITYPSTHGVFEADVTKICDITHEFGGQVYIDGANMNAMVGLSRPGDLGGDVSHLNLHKTFCIPHGGGGPGMGPIGVKSHLIPHLPSDPNEATGNGPVSAAAFGSASILPVSWAYILLCGSEGLTQATKVAILSANYIAKRLEGAYNILFTGQNGRIAHECILDTRPFANSTGISVDDIAKRLMDCGFHAPTMSWPVAGTLMVEPTESEPKAELDRFCDAMLGIAAEVKAIQEGTLDPENNPLKNAPHTVADLIEDWDSPYSREVAIYPAGAHRADKYFPAVNRVDNAHGDRNLVCTCPPMEDYG